MRISTVMVAERATGEKQGRRESEKGGGKRRKGGRSEIFSAWDTNYSTVNALAEDPPVMNSHRRFPRYSSPRCWLNFRINFVVDELPPDACPHRSRKSSDQRDEQSYGSSQRQRYQRVRRGRASNGERNFGWSEGSKRAGYFHRRHAFSSQFAPFSRLVSFFFFGHQPSTRQRSCVTLRAGSWHRSARFQAVFSLVCPTNNPPSRSFTASSLYAADKNNLPVNRRVHPWLENVARRQRRLWDFG